VNLKETITINPTIHALGISARVFFSTPYFVAILLQRKRVSVALGAQKQPVIAARHLNSKAHF